MGTRHKSTQACRPFDNTHKNRTQQKCSKSNKASNLLFVCPELVKGMLKVTFVVPCYFISNESTFCVQNVVVNLKLKN